VKCGLFRERIVMKRGMHKDLSSSSNQVVVEPDSADEFATAVNENDTERVKSILANLCPTEQAQLLNRVSPDILSKPAKVNKVAIVIMLLRAASPEKIQAMIYAGKYNAFRQAAANGCDRVVKLLLRIIAKTHKQDMIRAFHYMAFSRAAENGYDLVVDLILRSATQDDIWEMIRHDNFHAFNWAIRNGHTLVVEMLLAAVSWEQRQAMIRARNFLAFRSAAEYSNVEIVKLLLKEVDPKHKQEMIMADNFGAFRAAAASGHIGTMKVLLQEIDAAQKQAMIEYDNFAVFRAAARSGQAKAVELLLQEVAPENKQKMICALKFEAFKSAARCGRTAIVELLLREVANEHRRNMLVNDGFNTYLWAATNGHIPVMELLMRALSPEDKLDMVKANNFHLFCSIAAALGQTKMVDLFLREVEDYDKCKQEMIKAALVSTTLKVCRSTLPLLLAYADPKEVSINEYIGQCSNPKDVPNKIDAFKQLITYQMNFGCEEILSQRVMLMLVCRKPSNICNVLPTAVFTHVCTFLGIPFQFSAPNVKQPEMQPVGFSSKLDRDNEERSHDGLF